ncbi:MAG: transcription antitermination factor NusB [Verrucomicrobiota bacterium]
MPSRRQIREAVIQFLYCADLEGGAEPSDLKEPFWQFITESDRRALMLATWKTIHHLNLGREERHGQFVRRFDEAMAHLRARPDLEKAAERLDRIAILERDWSTAYDAIARIPHDDDDDSLSRRLETAIASLFSADRHLSAARASFFETLSDHPEAVTRLEAICGTIRRLDRISDRMRMIERPEDFPDQNELAKIRETRSSIRDLRDAADHTAGEVLAKKKEIDARLESVIENFAPERIDPIDRAILRLATWEILHNPDAPTPVAINEAIELAKRFGTTDSGRFVNGVLDRVAKSTVR